MMKIPIGCLGGTFDPPHRAHFTLAHTAYKQLNLAQLLLIPAGQPWQKPQVSPAKHRLAMLQAAIVDDKQAFHLFHNNPYPLSIETIEIDQPQASYTYDTLRVLREQFPDTPLVWVMGSDQLKNLTTWYEWTHLLDYTHIAVVQRAKAKVQIKDLPEPLISIYQEKVCTNTDWRKTLSGRFIPFECPPFAISSTQIRAAISTGQVASSITGLSPTVAHYIDTHHLYQPTP